jgi:uncharacterized repeat protein (TIGR01451 family)
VVEVDAGLPNGRALLSEAMFGAESTKATARADEVVVVEKSAVPISIVVTATPDPVQDGSNHIFTVVVSNESGTTQTSVALDIVVPEFVSYFANQTVPSWNVCSSGSTRCDPTKVMTWALGSLAPGEARTIHLSSLVSNSAIDGSLLTLLARVTYAGALTPVEASRTVMVSEFAPGLVVSLTADRDPVAPGERVEYRVGFGNRFGTTLTAGALSVRLPAGVSFVSATGGGTEVGDEVQWSLGFVASGESGFRDLVVEVDAGLPNGRALLDPSGKSREALRWL